jgi:hypothetical protein
MNRQYSINLRNKMLDELDIPNPKELFEKEKELEEREKKLKVREEELEKKELEFKEKNYDCDIKTVLEENSITNIIVCKKCKLKNFNLPNIDKLFIGNFYSCDNSINNVRIFYGEQFIDFDICENKYYSVMSLLFDKGNISKIYIGQIENNMYNFIDDILDNAVGYFVIDSIQIINNNKLILDILCRYTNYKKLVLSYEYDFDYQNIIAYCRQNNIELEYL